MQNSHYLIVKDKNKKEIAYFEYDKLSGFNMTSKNKNIKLKDAINVNKMVIINPSMVEKLIDKKINIRMKKLINLILNIYDSDDDPGSAMMQALNEIEKFKREMINKYLNYMNKKQLGILEDKIRMLESEVTKRFYVINENSLEEEEYETKKSR